MKLFIDANIFLDFYEIHAVKPLLDPLIEVSDHILVTDQVVAEVFRNKLRLANKKFDEYAKKLNLTISLPDILTENAVAEIDLEAGTKLKKLRIDLKDVKGLLDGIYAKTLEQISKNEDKISIELNKIFNNALSCSIEQVTAAKKRKELGNPPGKKGDPLGDEISWEQVLDFAKENTCSIWIVSKDGDFMTKSFNNSTIGNPYLLREVQLRGLPQFYFFDDLASALKKFQLEIQKELVLPSEDELAAASHAQTSPRTKHLPECDHLMEIIPDGVYDLYRCSKCGLGHRIYSDECCD